MVLYSCRAARRWGYLLDDVEAELQPLPLQHRDQVLEEDGQVLVSVPEGDQDGDLQVAGEHGSLFCSMLFMQNIEPQWRGWGGHKLTFQRGLQSFGFQRPPYSTSKNLENLTSISSMGISVMFTSIRPSEDRASHGGEGVGCHISRILH